MWCFWGGAETTGIAGNNTCSELNWHVPTADKDKHNYDRPVWHPTFHMNKVTPI